MCAREGDVCGTHACMIWSLLPRTNTSLLISTLQADLYWHLIWLVSYILRSMSFISSACVDVVKHPAWPVFCQASSLMVEVGHWRSNKWSQITITEIDFLCIFFQFFLLEVYRMPSISQNLQGKMNQLRWHQCSFIFVTIWSYENSDITVLTQALHITYCISTQLPV